MIEAPHARLCAEWLLQRLPPGQEVAWESPPGSAGDLAGALGARRVADVRSLGTSVLVVFEGGARLRHDLPPGGRWRRLPPDGALPTDALLVASTPGGRVVAEGGRLAFEEPGEIEDPSVPDVVATPFPGSEIAGRIARDARPLAESLQAGDVALGVGPIAASEACYAARVDPLAAGSDLPPAARVRVVDALFDVTREALRERGRWRRRVHGRESAPCARCGAAIERLGVLEPEADVYRCASCLADAGEPGRGADAAPERGRGELRVGCAIWAYKDWEGALYPRGTSPRDYLRLYSSRFSAVEGNTTFWAIPTVDTLRRWRAEMAPGFRLCPKLPRDLTHAGELSPHCAEAGLFIDRMRELGDRLGPFFAQLPGTYGPERMDDLDTFLRAWPAGGPALLLEVRHPDWFGEPWRTRLTELLAELGVGRAVLDSRAVHAGPDDPQAESKRRKPELPFHPDVTSDTAFVRFIAHPLLERNHRLLDEVAELAVQWLARGKQTYLFAHCPDERQSVHVARELHRRIERLDPAVPELPWPELEPEARQLDLFGSGPGG